MPRSNVPFLTALAVLSLAVTSCSWVGKDGTRHTLVLGLGVLSIKELAKDKATITQSSSLGFTLRASPTATGLMLGYQQCLVTQIPEHWNGHFGLQLTPHYHFRVHSSAQTPIFPPAHK